MMQFLNWYGEHPFVGTLMLLWLYGTIALSIQGIFGKKKR